MGGVGQYEGGDTITQVGNVVFGKDAEVSAWVQDRIEGYVVSGGYRAVGVVNRGNLVAGVVFENWNGIHIEAAIAAASGAGWASRKTLRTLFAYPFNYLNCKAISVSVASTNILSLNLAAKLGFEPEAIIRFAAHDGSSLVVLKMLKEKCQWIK